MEKRSWAKSGSAMPNRIRDVVQGPDGAIYALTDADKGKILKLTPAR